MKAVYSFSLAGKKWAPLKNLPSGRIYHGSVSTKDGIYIVGGTSNKNVDKFDPLTRNFKNVSSLEIYLEYFGICQYNSESFIVAGGYETSKTTYLYNTKYNTFKQVGDLNSKRVGDVLVKSEDGDIYAIGGMKSRNELSNTIEKFDRKNQSWKVVDAKLVLSRFNHQAVAYKNFIYVIGGRLQTGSVTNTIEKFNLRTEKVEIMQTKLNVARTGFAVAKLKKYVYIIGGDTTDYSIRPRPTVTSTNSVEIFQKSTIK